VSLIGQRYRRPKLNRRLTDKCREATSIHPVPSNELAQGTEKERTNSVWEYGGKGLSKVAAESRSRSSNGVALTRVQHRTG
jgi:hypothetical protein